MPPKRKPAAQAAVRRNPEPEDANMRTRSGGRGKPVAGKTDQNNPPASQNGNGSSPILTRKKARPPIDFSKPSSWVYRLDTPEPEVYATYDRPYLKIVNLDPDFLVRLKKTEKTTRPKKVILRYPAPRDSTTPESEVASDSPPALQPAPARRGRGGRGSRSRGRGRGGRGGAARKEAFPEKPVQVSPKKNRPVRIAAPAFPLTEVDEESPSNHDSPYESAKETVQHHQPSPLLDNITINVEDVDDQVEPEPMQGVESTNVTPKLSPPRGCQTPESATPAVAAPRQASESQEPNAPTPKEDSTSTPAEPIQIVNPEDDVYMDDDLLAPFLTDIKKPTREECEDEADYLLRTRYDPLNDATAIVEQLTKYPASARSNEVLWKLATHAQETLQAWQDQFLKLDQKTAPHQHPPKKPAHGGRVPVNPPVYEDMKEADLYGYVFDARKPPGGQDAFAQRVGRDNIGGRELRQRRNREVTSAAVSEDEDEDNLGRGNRRKRRAVQRFDATTEPNTGANTPRSNGWGGARKRGASAMAPAGSETPEPDARAKRAKTAANALLPQRVQEMREESMVISSGDEAGSNASKRRGRPPGSKNLQKRSDAGIKKGPRKGTITAAQTPKPAPVTLESLSQGQNQFSIEPRLAAPVLQHQPNSSSSMPASMAAPVATVFQAAPQPASAPSPGLPPSSALHPHTPENLFTTTPLSQYSAMPSGEASSAAPGTDKKRKQRVKSEKRSLSMTIWWKERKARAAQQKAEQQAFQGTENQYQKRPLAGGSPRTSPPPSSPRSLGTSRAPSRAPQPTLLPLNSGLAALPSNPPINPSPRPGMPTLAPAPAAVPNHPHIQPTFASPYPPPPPPAPRPVIPRPKSGGQPPLAPAPPTAHRREGSGHISPYPPVGPAIGQHVLGPVGGVPGVQGSFKRGAEGGRGGN